VGAELAELADQRDQARAEVARLRARLTELEDAAQVEEARRRERDHDVAGVLALWLADSHGAAPADRDRYARAWLTLATNEASLEGEVGRLEPCGQRGGAPAMADRLRALPMPCPGCGGDDVWRVGETEGERWAYAECWDCGWGMDPTPWRVRPTIGEYHEVVPLWWLRLLEVPDGA
jgi:predicted RNA-binding Zn-ribbon protein involved in translation (DUF1610 family)